MSIAIKAKSNINKFLRVNYIWFFPVIMCILYQVAFWILNQNTLLDINKVDHNALLTINLTLSGFLLTGIGIMVSIRDKEFIQILLKAGYWQLIERSAFWGIAFHTASALISLANMITKIVTLVLFNIETTCFIIGITFFIMVVVWLKKALKYL